VVPILDEDPLPLTFRNLTVFISFKNAAIFSEGRPTVGLPVRLARDIPPKTVELIGVSTGAAVCRKEARVEAKRVSASDMDEVARIAVDTGGGGGGGGGGGMKEKEWSRLES
jgi:hypothetical protein